MGQCSPPPSPIMHSIDPTRRCFAAIPAGTPCCCSSIVAQIPAVDPWQPFQSRLITADLLLSLSRAFWACLYLQWMAAAILVGCSRL